MVLFIPGFMQRGDAWRPVAELLPERYPSRLLDHAEHSFEGRLARDRRRAGADVAAWATRSAAGSHCAPRFGRPRPSPPSCSWVRRRALRSGPMRVQRAEADEKLASWMEAMPIEDIVALLGAPAAVRGPVRGARRGAAARAACRTTRARSPCCCAPPARARSTRSGTSCARSSCRARDRGRPRRRLQRGGEADRVGRRRTRGPRSWRRRGTRRSCSSPRRWPS